MLRSRRDYSLAKDQPILLQARRRSRTRAKNRSEADFWLMFDLEKFGDWQREQQSRRLAE